MGTRERPYNGDGRGRQRTAAMKTIYLLRHAKSDWGDPILDDFDRPLAARGRQAAPRIAAFMRAKGLVPDVVLCSAARRTLETWDYVAPELGDEIPVSIRRSLYHGSPGQLLAALRRLPDEVSSVLLVGHSPGIERLAMQFSGTGSDDKALHRLRGKFPTAALAVIAVDTDAWDDIGQGRGRLTHFVRPKDLA